MLVGEEIQGVKDQIRKLEEAVEDLQHKHYGPGSPPPMPIFGNCVLVHDFCVGVSLECRDQTGAWHIVGQHPVDSSAWRRMMWAERHWVPDKEE